jgi:hypothetical protein
MLKKVFVKDYTKEIAKLFVIERKSSTFDWIANFDFVYDLITKHNYKRIVDLGIHSGQSTRCLLSAVITKNDGSFVIAIDSDKKCYGEHFKITDDFIDPVNLYKYLIFYNIPGEQVLKIDGFVRKEKMDVSKCVYMLERKTNNQDPEFVLPEEIDLLHIDTDPHSFEQTMMWLNSDYMKRIVVGGRVLFHDVDNCNLELPVALDEWYSKNKDKWRYGKHFFNKYGLGEITRVEK